jgi:hypothetical protein
MIALSLGRSKPFLRVPTWRCRVSIAAVRGKLHVQQCNMSRWGQSTKSLRSSPLRGGKSRKALSQPRGQRYSGRQDHRDQQAYRWGAACNTRSCEWTYALQSARHDLSDCRHTAGDAWHGRLSHCSRQLIARPPPWAAIAGNEDCIATRRASAASVYFAMRQLQLGTDQATYS